MIKERRNVMLYGALLSIYVVLFLGYFILTFYEIIEYSHIIFLVLIGFFIVDTAFVVFLRVRLPKQERNAAYERYQYNLHKDPTTYTFKTYHDEDEISFNEEGVFSTLHNMFFYYNELTFHAFIVEKVPYDVVNIFVELDYHTINTKDDYTHVNIELSEDLYLVLRELHVEVACLDEIMENLKDTLKIKS